MTVTRVAYALSGGLLGASTDTKSTPIAPATGEPRALLGVAVLGLGYVGLPTALAFASYGISVTGIDTNNERLDAIRRRHVDVIESDRTRLEEALRRPDFALTNDPAALARADAVVICVPTPVDEHLSPDLRPLSAACSTVVAHARPDQTIILTSTTYVGTTREMLVEPLAQRGLVAGRNVFVAFSPERIDPGNAHAEHLHVPRVVGGVTSACLQHASNALVPVCSRVHPVSSAETAEMTKLYENIFRAVNIALANEIAEVTRALDVDAMEVIDAASTKPYGFMAFYPGPGVGGHCIPCDPHYLRWQLRALREESPVIDQAMDAIARRPRVIVRRVSEALSERGIALRDARVLVYGASYKSGVSDTRESPAIEIIDELATRGARVEFYDRIAPVLRTKRGERRSLPSPDGDWDLVLVHTIHSTDDVAWLSSRDGVLDATYRLPRTRGVVTA